MDAKDFDTQISPDRLPAPALLTLFSDVASPVKVASLGVIPALVNDAERFGKGWLRQNAKHLTLSAAPRAVRIAATMAEGVEITLHMPVLVVDRRSFRATPAGTVVVIYQQNTPTWKIRAEPLAIISRNLAKRRHCVPVRPSEAMLIREQAEEAAA